MKKNINRSADAAKFRQAEKRHKKPPRPPTCSGAPVDEVRRVSPGELEIIVGKRAEEAKALRASMQFAQAALDALAAYICILDENGVIIAANAAWRKLGASGQARSAAAGEGANYFAVCGRMIGLEPVEAEKFATGLRQVLAGQSDQFSMELPCKSADGQRWFLGRATRFSANGSALVVVTHENITERKRLEDRLSKCYACLLKQGSDSNANINRLTALCGEILGGTCALYNRLEGNLLCSVGQWNTPADYDPKDKPEGHICYDLIQRNLDSVLVIRNLASSAYARTDTNIARYGLQTYIGKTVKCGGQPVGSLCVVYQKDFVPTEDDKKIMSIIAANISVEEERHREENMLRANEVKYRRLYETSRDAIMTLEPPSWKFTSGNPATIKMFKAKNEEEFLACEPWILSPKHQPDGRLSDEKAKAMIAKAMREGSHFFEWTHKRISGEEFPASVLLSRLARDNFAFLQATVRDITDQKQAEEALKETKSFTESAINSITDIFYSFDSSGRFLNWNKTFRIFSGYSDQELSSMKPTDFFIGEDIQRIAEAVERIYKDGTSKVEADFVSKDGRLIPCEFTGSILRDGKGNIIGFSGTGRDITTRKQAEEKIRKLNENLEQIVRERTAELARANQELETMIRVATHDLRSPLVNIQGFGQILNRTCDEISAMLTSTPLLDELRQSVDAAHEKIGKSLRFINASVDKMNSLISGLLHLSRLDHTPLAIKPLDMNALVKAVLEAMTFQLRTAAAQVTADALPACRGDMTLINQVFSNLLDNAVKYRDSTRPLRVRIWGRREDARAVYCIEDNGLGVAPEHQPKIWNVFYRINPQGNIPGDGLGLSSVQRIMERHGGKIWMESEAGKGSRFFLSLPAIAEEQSP